LCDNYFICENYQRNLQIFKRAEKSLIKNADLQKHLKENGVPSMIYYPVPLYRQKAFKEFVAPDFCLSTTKKLCDLVLSLPIHTEMTEDLLDYISNKVKVFFNHQ
jgi:dTDP-4-amino-4,6-dideoxygalactose transaminase